MPTDKDCTPLLLNYQHSLIGTAEKQIEMLKKGYLRTSTAIARVHNTRRRAALWTDFHRFTGLYANEFHVGPEKYILEMMAYNTSRLISRGEMPVGMPKSKSVDSPDLGWFLANIDSLVKLYNGDWIAIVNRRVVANAQTPKGLREILKEKNISGPFITKASYEAWSIR